MMMMFRLLAISCILGNVESNPLFDRFSQLDAGDQGPPEHVLAKFRESHFVIAGHPLFVQPFSSTSIHLEDGTECSLEGAQPFDLFTNDCTFNGVSCKSLTTVFSVPCGNDVELVISKSANGSITSVLAQAKNGRSKTYEVVDNSFVAIPDGAYDRARLSKFKYGSEETHPGRRGLTVEEHDSTPLLRGGNVESGVHRERGLQGSCGGNYKVIEVATPFDSTFCNKFTDEAGAFNRLQTVIAGVSSKYMQDLCTKVKIVEADGTCTYANDDYKDGVATGLSGCSNDGLLDYVRQHWINNKTNTPRDTVQMMTGTDFFNDGNTIGCAWIEVLCDNDWAYGVNEATWTNSDDLVIALVSHELGHNSGAIHYEGRWSNRRDYIMEPSINDGSDGFASQSTDAMIAHISSVSCISEETGTTEPPVDTTESPVDTTTAAPPVCERNSPCTGEGAWCCESYTCQLKGKNWKCV